MIRWVFLDMGNVVLNDDPSMTFLYRKLFAEMTRQGSTVTFAELMREREEVIRTRGSGHWSVLTERYLGSDGHERLMLETRETLRREYLRYHNVMPGMPAALAALADEFALAIVANQMREAETALQVLDLRKHFRFVGFSEVLGLQKPDPAIYAWALERAGVPPEDALMVGDRIDNDVLPAKRLGLATVWFHPPLAEKGYLPEDDLARAHHESQGRIRIADLRPRGDEERPDREARSVDELVAAVRALHRAA